MEEKSEKQFNSAAATNGRPSGTLAELAGLSAPDNVSESTRSSIHLSEHVNERDNAVNSAFANLLLGIRVGDGPRQKDAYNTLIRIARSAARKSGYMFYSFSGDYEEIANNCLAQEVEKHRQLTAFEIVERSNAKKFAYLWIAFKRRFIDELRKTTRRGEQRTDGYQHHPQPISQQAGSIEEVEMRWNRQAAAKQFQQASKFLPFGQAAVSEALAELMQDPELLHDFADWQISHTAFKSRFVEYVASRRGVDAQIVRRDLQRFRQHRDEPEYARIGEILRDTNHRAYALDRLLNDSTHKEVMRDTNEPVGRTS